MTRVIDIAQGNVAKLIDTAAVHLLWRVARGKSSEHERQVAAVFPSLLHIPSHVHLPADRPGAVNSVMGTWSRENLLDYLGSGPGGIRRFTSSDSANWIAAIGTEAAFPTSLPATTWLTPEPGQSYCFGPAEGEVFDADADYLPRTAAWYRREAQRTALDERERDGAFSAARIAELWLDSSRGGALERLDAFELELRMRRMGMAAADGFAQRFGWTHRLMGVEAVRAFNRVLAPWVAATLMPEPFRLGLIDRGFAHPGLSAVLLAASAAATNLEQAAAECAHSPRILPVRGIKYVRLSADLPPHDQPLHRLIKAVHGVPIFAPINGHPDGLWEMFIPLRVDRLVRPTIFRQPSPLALRREMESIHSILVRVGPPMSAASDDRPETGAIEVSFLSETCTVGSALRQAAVGGGSLARAVHGLWLAAR